MDLQIESRNVDMTPRWKTEIEQRMEGLQVGHDDLIHGRMTITKNKHHKKDARVAEALVLVTLPGRHTITARKEEKTFEEAIRAAFSAVEIELQKFETSVASQKSGPSRSLHCAGPLVSCFHKRAMVSFFRTAEAKSIFIRMRYADWGFKI